MKLRIFIPGKYSIVLQCEASCGSQLIYLKLIMCIIVIICTNCLNSYITWPAFCFNRTEIWQIWGNPFLLHVSQHVLGGRGLNLPPILRVHLPPISLTTSNQSHLPPLINLTYHLPPILVPSTAFVKFQQFFANFNT